MATYPGAVASFSTKSDNDVIEAAHPNTSEAEIVALETALKNGIEHVLRPLTDNTRDLGTSSFGWRDLHIARNALVAGTLGVTGKLTAPNSVIKLRGVDYTLPAADAAGVFTSDGAGAVTWAARVIIQTTTATGGQDNFAVTAARRLLLRCNNASLLTFTGFAAGTAGDIIDVVSIGAGQVDLDHQVTSTDANKLINFATVGMTSLAAAVGTARYIYDGTTARWRLVEHEQGAWISPAFSAGDYTPNSGTWTVESGDVKAYAFWLQGRTLTVAMSVSGSTTSSATAPQSIAIPASYVSTGVAVTTGYADDGATRRATRIEVAASGTTTVHNYIPQTNPTDQTNDSGLHGTMSFEIN